ncbi:MAG TPA: methionyl-tRNA formyltransferase [Candidatus Hydrogenedentes bacterium]|nr:methionyl-tRNA formyltransferase [Candidatus Hydrogenedentota bacterium]
MSRNGFRVLFFGNSQSAFSNRHFQALIHADCRVVGVVDAPPPRRTSTNPAQASDSAFTQIARQHEIPVLAPAEPNAPACVGWAADLCPHLLVAVGYPYRLRGEMLTVPLILPVNFHASLLPAYRGMHPVFWALRNGEKYAGLTVHVMDEALDTGAIVYQVRVRTRPDDTVRSLYDRIIDKSVDLIPRLIADAGGGTISARPQGVEGASYYGGTRNEDFRLDWAAEADQLRRWIVITPGKCFCDVAGTRVYLSDAEMLPIDKPAPFGTVLASDGRACVVAASHGALRLRKGRIDKGGEQDMALILEELDIRIGDTLNAAPNQRKDAQR